MITLFILCWEFFKTGLFAVGGGVATIPFLYEISDKYGWFTHHELLDMIAVSESTPGSIGMNMATYVGYKVAGVAGGISATLSLALPSIIIILIVARVLQKFRQNRFVEGGFYILRPTSMALITAAALSVLLSVLFNVESISVEIFTRLGEIISQANYIGIVLFVIILVLMNIKPLKKVHPIFFILASAALGIALKL